MLLDPCLDRILVLAEVIGARCERDLGEAGDVAMSAEAVQALAWWSWLAAANNAIGFSPINRPPSVTARRCWCALSAADPDALANSKYRAA